MSGKSEEQLDGSKRSEKRPKKDADTHREFLDMDTDEEDFGRQETPEEEEELPPEPDKPVYDEEELTLLMQYVKSLAILPASEETNWDEHCYEIIREYFEDPSHTILSILYIETTVTAVLTLPDHAPKGFTYFLRRPWQIFTSDNFLATVTFGTINENLQDCVLKLTETVYAPTLLNTDYCPEIIVNELFSNLHKFLICLSEEVYKPIGLTMLYLPRERFLKEFHQPDVKSPDLSSSGKEDPLIVVRENAAREEAVCRLENVVWSWIKLIRTDIKNIPIRNNVWNMMDEVQYWNARCINLMDLYNQLANPDICLTVRVLRQFHSPSVESIEELIDKVQERLDEAYSNLMYLQILSESCGNLNITDQPEKSITNALLLIMFIWTESPYYNTTNAIEVLCQSLSTQVIYHCKQSVNLDAAFGTDPEIGIDIMEKCIHFCDAYQVIYDKLTLNIAGRVNSGRRWNVNRRKVFSAINIFRNRCLDVVYISRSLIVFGRCNKIGLAGSPRGKEYEMYCQRIENLLCESLEENIAVRDIILDVKSPLWFMKIQKYKRTVADLENTVNNLIDEMFEHIQNVEEGIEVLYALQNFQRLENLRDKLDTKWTQVWKIFLGQVKRSLVSVTVETGETPVSLCGSSTVVNLSCVSKHLKAEYAIIINAMDWLGDCAIERSISQQYERVLDTIDQKRNMLETDKE